MAIGTPVDRGTAKRFITTGDLLSSSFTSITGELLFAYISISGNSTLIPDSISGHAPASGDGSWVQVGTTQHTAGSSQDSVSLWVGRSAGATESITVSFATASLMTASFVSVTGCSTVGSALNALVQYDEDWNYTKTLSLSLPSVANTSIHFWERGQAGAFQTVDGVTLNTIDGNYNTCHIATSYVSGGATVPSVHYGDVNNTYLVGFAVELKPEGNVTFVNVDGDDIIQDGQTTVAINLGEGGNSITTIKLEVGGLSVAQSNVSITNDTLLTFDVVTGSLPWGVINLVATAGGQEFSYPITLIPINGNEYVIIADSIYDNPQFLSVLDNAPGPAIVDGDVLEYTDSTNKIVVNASGTYIVDPSGPSSFLVRRWSLTTEVWGDWVAVTITSAELEALTGALSITGFNFGGSFSIIEPTFFNAALQIGQPSLTASMGLSNFLLSGALQLNTITVSLNLGGVDNLYSISWELIKQGGNKHRAKIYNSRDNYYRFKVYNDGNPYVDINQTTNAIFNLYDSAGNVQNINMIFYSDKFTWTFGDGVLEINLDAFTVKDGEFYHGELIIYNYAHDDGVVVIDRDDFILEGG